MRRASLGMVCVALGCGTTGNEVADTARRDAAEPEVITDADTTGPEPEPLRFFLAGNEPFWGLTIDAAGLRFRTPDDTAGVAFGAATPVMVGDTLRWNSIGDAGMIEAVAVRARCMDTMADKAWPYRARVTIGTTRYEGCAEPR